MQVKGSSLITWVEIPVLDLPRAKVFYETLMNVSLTDLDLGDQLGMSVFPSQPDMVGMALIKHANFYKPGHQGPLIYLNMNPDLQHALDLVESAGGQIILQKRQISDEHGYMAVITDTEGNRIALHSQH